MYRSTTDLINGYLCSLMGGGRRAATPVTGFDGDPPSSGRQPCGPMFGIAMSVAVKMTGILLLVGRIQLDFWNRGGVA